MILVTQCKFSRTYVQMSKVLILLILNAFRILKRRFFWVFSSPPKLAGKYIFIPRFNCIPRKSSVCFKITYLTTNQIFFSTFKRNIFRKKIVANVALRNALYNVPFFRPVLSSNKITITDEELQTRSMKSEVVLLKNETTVF